MEIVPDLQKFYFNKILTKINRFENFSKNKPITFLINKNKKS